MKKILQIFMFIYFIIIPLQNVNAQQIMPNYINQLQINNQNPIMDGARVFMQQFLQFLGFTVMANVVWTITNFVDDLIEQYVKPWFNNSQTTDNTQTNNDGTEPDNFGMQIITNSDTQTYNDRTKPGNFGIQIVTNSDTQTQNTSILDCTKCLDKIDDTIDRYCNGNISKTGKEEIDNCLKPNINNPNPIQDYLQYKHNTYIFPDGICNINGINITKTQTN